MLNALLANRAAGASEMDRKACVAAGEPVGNRRINGASGNDAT